MQRVFLLVFCLGRLPDQAVCSHFQWPVGDSLVSRTSREVDSGIWSREHYDSFGRSSARHFHLPCSIAHSRRTPHAQSLTGGASQRDAMMELCKRLQQPTQKRLFDASHGALFKASLSVLRRQTRYRRRLKSSSLPVSLLRSQPPGAVALCRRILCGQAHDRRRPSSLLSKPKSEQDDDSFKNALSDAS